VLGSAFAVVNRTLNNATQTQEHQEALGHLQGQVEKLKVMARSPGGAAVFTQGGGFCIYSAGAGPLTMRSIGGTLPNAAYPGECNVGPGGRYHLGIVQQPAGSNTFKAYATWDGLTGRTEQVNLVYKLYP
jgi:hypothetical protein